MGYEFSVWEQREPLENTAAAARVTELASGTPGEALGTLLTALNEDCPPDADDTPWATAPSIAGAVLKLAFGDEHVEDLAEGFVELCGESGLIVFDPQETQLFWPADCVVSELDLLLDNGSRFATPSAELISNSLRDLTNGGFVILSRSPDDYVQTLRDEEDGEVILECRRGSEAEHYCCPLDELSAEQVEAVFLAYAKKDPGWDKLVAWESVDFSDEYDDALDDGGE